MNSNSNSNRILIIVFSLLLLSVISFIGYFGYTTYSKIVLENKKNADEVAFLKNEIKKLSDQELKNCTIGELELVLSDGTVKDFKFNSSKDQILISGSYENTEGLDVECQLNVYSLITSKFSNVKEFNFTNVVLLNDGVLAYSLNENLYLQNILTDTLPEILLSEKILSEKVNRSVAISGPISLSNTPQIGGFAFIVATVFECYESKSVCDKRYNALIAEGSLGLNYYDQSSKKITVLKKDFMPY